MLTTTFLTNEYVDKNVHVKIIRRDRGDGYFELSDGEIVIGDGSVLYLDRTDIEGLIKIFKLIDQKGGTCI